MTSDNAFNRQLAGLFNQQSAEGFLQALLQALFTNIPAEDQGQQPLRTSGLYMHTADSGDAILTDADNFYLLKQMNLAPFAVWQTMLGKNNDEFDSLPDKTGYVSPQALDAMSKLLDQGVEFDPKTFRAEFKAGDLDIAIDDLIAESAGLDTNGEAIRTLLQNHKENVRSIMEGGQPDMQEQLLRANIGLSAGLNVMLEQEKIKEMFLSDKSLGDQIEEDQFRASLNTFTIMSLDIAQNNGVDAQAVIDRQFKGERTYNKALDAVIASHGQRVTPDGNWREVDIKRFDVPEGVVLYTLGSGMEDEIPQSVLDVAAAEAQKQGVALTVQGVKRLDDGVASNPEYRLLDDEGHETKITVQWHPDTGRAVRVINDPDAPRFTGPSNGTVRGRVHNEADPEKRPAITNAVNVENQPEPVREPVVEYKTTLSDVARNIEQILTRRGWPEPETPEQKRAYNELMEDVQDIQAGNRNVENLRVDTNSLKDKLNAYRETIDGSVYRPNSDLTVGGEINVIDYRLDNFMEENNLHQSEPKPGAGLDEQKDVYKPESRPVINP